MNIRKITAALVAGAAALALAGCTSAGGDEAKITLRLWDEKVADVYEESIAAFEDANPGIDVELNVVPWSDYFTTLRSEVGSGGGDDLFWLNGAYFEDYAAAGSLVNIDDALGKDAREGWAESAVQQYLYEDALYGVPQLTDGGTGLYLNSELLAEAGVTAEELSNAAWNPDPEKDTLLPLLQKLTIDENGNNAASPDFDPKRVKTYGYSAALELQNIQLNYIASNGGTYQNEDGSKLTFTDPKTVEAYQYIVDLINKYHVAPPAESTNDDGDYTRELFLQGKLAVFQSGTYNLAQVNDNADFEWQTAEIPAGPAGKGTTAPAVIVAGNTNTKYPEAQQKLLEWLGSAEGAKYIADSGAAIPAVTDARADYDAYWQEQGVDTSPFFTVLEGREPFPPVIGKNYGAQAEAFTPPLKEVFLGKTPVKEGLQKAQDAADKVA
ncbi:sugar ABC transporter substrate-binding protein [Gulosibacter sp. GYB002]|uniref:ABC transporter substrate-binding protein n=1 Tax=Gulosibacter sp. GYB002 TaxID=2994391 RepID=UPI002F96429E